MRKFFSWIYSFFEELFALILCMFLYFFRSKKLDRPKNSEGKPNIVCVHGYLHNESPWRFLRRFLQVRGAGPVDTVYYQSVKNTVEANSLKVKEKVDQILTETGREVNVFIGHSLGGLVCLEYALEHAPRDKKITVITLGSPLNGTKAAFFGWGPSVNEMCYHSDYIRSLHHRLSLASHIQLLCLASSTDLLIFPHDSAILPQIPYAKHEWIDGLGHISFLFSHRVYEKIFCFFKTVKIL